jgi:short-subunit dehydrogenase
MSNKTVLITGCSSGIGAALAKECKMQGLHVIATARNPKNLSDLKALEIECLQLDVNSQEDINSLLEHLKNTSQAIDFIINNAGFGTMIPMADLNPEDLLAQFQTNVFSIVNLTNALIPSMVERRSGCIVNIGSVSGILTTPFAGAYCASKSALHSISEAYRMELAPFGIKVLIVQPGAIASAFGENASEVTEGLIHENSMYKQIETAIRKRANASQERPSSAESFASQLVKQMLKDNPPSVMRIGNGAKVLPLLPRLLPSRLLDKILSKPFQLNKLNK